MAERTPTEFTRMSEEELIRIERSAAMGGVTREVARRLVDELRRERALLERLGGDLKAVARRAKN
jgi:hypothetical protein